MNYFGEIISGENYFIIFGESLELPSSGFSPASGNGRMALMGEMAEFGVV